MPWRREVCPQPMSQTLHQSRKDAVYGPVLSDGDRTPSFDTPTRWPLGRPERPLARGRMFGIAMTLSRYSSIEWRAKRQTLPFCDCGVFVCRAAAPGVLGTSSRGRSWPTFRCWRRQCRNTAVPPRLLAARLQRSARGARVDVTRAGSPESQPKCQLWLSLR